MRVYIIIIIIKTSYYTLTYIFLIKRLAYVQMYYLGACLFL